MAIQELTGQETGTQFINKLNNNFLQGSNVHPFRVKMERGGLKATGAMDYTIASYNGYVRSSMLIKVNDATRVIGKTLTGFTVYEYKVANNAIVYNKVSNEGDTFHADTRYIKIVKQTSILPEEVVLLFDGDVEEVYNVQIETGSSSGHLLSETLVFDIGEDVCTTARLLLPSGYSINGKKVPLILWCGCDDSYANYSNYANSWDFSIDNVGGMTSFITDELQYVVGQGFAVLNVYPWGSDNFTKYNMCGRSGAVPVPVTLRAYEKAVEYVTSRFNISDTNIFQLSFSGSGKLSAYWAIHKPAFNLRHIYAFSPVVDGGEFGLSENLGGSEGFRAATNSEMHFEGTEQQITDYVNGNNLLILGTGKTLTDEQVIAFKKLNAGKFAKFSSIQWQNLTGTYMKDGVLHNHDIDDKIADSLAWAKTWITDTGYASSHGNPDNSTYSNWSSFRGRIYNRYDLAITGNGAPITIIGAEDDCACPFMAMEQFIIQLQNGGNEAKLIILPNENADNGGVGTGHDMPYGHRAAVRYNQIVSGIGYGWWYAVQDIKSRFLKQQ